MAQAAGSPLLYYGSPDWLSLPGGGSFPPARNYAFGAFDGARNRDVVFGGYGSTGFLGDTWLFNGTAWSNAAPASAPSARDGAQMAFDAATGTAILFGGWNGSSDLGDTWSWNGTTWTHLAPGTSPSPRSQGVMAYDATLGEVILFGGYNGASLSDTWAWNGTTWTLVATVGPSGRYDAAMAYDSSAGNLVLFGGVSSGSVYDGDTWLYGSSGWTQPSPANGPGVRAGEGLAFDPVLNRVIFYGGYTAAQTFEDTWLWNGQDWERAYVGVVPAYRSTMVFLTAAGNGQVMVYGGYSPKGSYWADTALYDWLKAGGAPGATIESHATSDRSSFGVNAANGNLVATATDLQVSGVGVNLTFNRVYNEEQPVVGGMIASDWAFSTADMYLSGLPDSNLVLYGYGGAAGQLFFHRNPDASFTSPPGINATMALSGSQFTLTTNKTSEKYTFNTNGQLASDADRNGVTVTYTYNISSQLSTVTDTQGRQYTLAYYPSGYLDTITDPTGRVVTYSQDANGNLTGVTGPYGNFTYGHGPIGYSSTGLTSIQNPRGNTWNFAFYTDFRTQTVTFPPNGSGGGPTTTGYTYGPPDDTAYGWEKTVSTDANNHATTYIASYAGQAVKTTDALNRSRSASYTANDDIQMATDAMSPGNNTTFTYDALNNPTSEAQPTGATNYLAYSNGAPMSPGVTCSSTDSSHPYLAKCSEDGQGHQSTYTYDGPGNKMTTTSATAGLQESNSYNPATPTCGGKVGQLCSTKNGNNNTTSYHYDANGNLDAITPPAPLGATTITVDPLGRPATVTDGRGKKTTYGYNTNDQPLQVLTGGATTCASRVTCVTYGYDNDGDLTLQIDNTGTTIYGYDNLDRQTSKQLPSGAPLTLSYDPAGNVATYVDGGGTVTYGYDAANQLTTLKEPSLAQTTFGYNNNAVRTSTTYPGGTTLAFTPDKSGRPQEVKATNGPIVLEDFTYTHNAGTSDTALIQTGTDTVAANTTTYSYDGLNQLTNGVEKHGSTTTASWRYCYDNDGNLTSKSTTVGAVCPGAITYTYNAADEITARNGNTSGWTYDASGNETAGKGPTTRTAETYSATNQLTSMKNGGVATTFAYAGLTSAERVATGATTYQTGEEGLANQTTSGATTNWTRDPGGTLISQRVGGQSYYYLYDGLGNVTGLVNATGTKINTYTYSPYGEARTATETIANPWRFQANYLDTNSGLYHNGARYYDPTLGRFTQLDPSSQNAGYVYAGDDPINDSDPSGLGWDIGDTWTVFGAAVTIIGAFTGVDEAAFAVFFAFAISAALWGEVCTQTNFCSG